MKNKIDNSLYNEVKALTKNKLKDVVIFTNNFDEVISILKNSKKNYKTFPFINAICTEMSLNEIVDISNVTSVEYIQSQSKVFAQMNYVNEILNVNSFHKQNILGQNQTIAFIDTGICNHLDFVSFQDRIIFFKDFVNDKKLPYDDNGHGTFVVGVSAGNGFCSGDKFKGVAPMAKIIMLKTLNEKGETGALNILNAMEWIYNNKEIYDIGFVCMSFGSIPLSAKDPLMIGAEALLQKGITVVAAAGNSGPEAKTIMSPGISNKIITVGGFDDHRQLDCKKFNVAKFSSRGPAFSFFKPDIVAPSVDIISTGTNEIMGFYSKMSGTSVATPIVCGLCVLIKQKHPNFSPRDIKNYLLKHCKSLGDSKNAQGNGFPFLT